MRYASNRRQLGGAGVGLFLLGMAVLVLGCAPQDAAPRMDAPVVQASSPAAVPAVANDQPAAPAAPAAAEPPVVAAAQTPASGSGETVAVGACDGSGTVEVSKDLRGRALADNLMDQWQRDHPEAEWVREEKERHALKPPADNSALLKGAQGAGHPYGNYTERELLTWTRETEKFVAEGSRVFHSADALGSAVAVSCDMCHPHAANTHPETYPKYQVQLGHVALLRDMINWCMENPVRADKLAPDSPAMRALEAYIQSQRQGVPLNYGKH